MTISGTWVARARDKARDRVKARVKARAREAMARANKHQDEILKAVSRQVVRREASEVWKTTNLRVARISIPAPALRIAVARIAN